MKRIGIVGTGIMGAGIAANYLKHGYEVLVWNRTPERLEPLIQAGARSRTTPRRIAEEADILFEVTASDESSRAVWTGKDGILAAANPAQALIASGTFSTGWVDELAALCAARGFTFFDMPMTGGRSGAENGKLQFLAGGDEARLEALKPDLAAVSEKVIYFGKHGAGARYKLLLNMLQAIHVLTMGEVLKVAEAAGMDVARVGNALAERPGGTTTNLAWRDYQKTPDPINFSVEWILKDLEYARGFAGALDLPLLEDALSKYRAAVAQGLGGEDWTRVNKV